MNLTNKKCNWNAIVFVKTVQHLFNNMVVLWCMVHMNKLDAAICHQNTSFNIAMRMQWWFMILILYILWI